jgi:hypothetical protein
MRTSKICPNWDFWFENKPSGNPAVGRLFTLCSLFEMTKVSHIFGATLSPQLGYALQTFGNK